MGDIYSLLIIYGAWLVFANVLLEQAGLPIPAYPLLVVSGALAAQGLLSWPLIMINLVVACLIADSLWYAAGRKFGGGLLSRICKISLSPDSCIRDTQNRYVKVGPQLLLIAKFLPGAGALGTVMAGLTGTSYRRFLAYDLAGTLIWGGSAVAIGALFSPLVATILLAIDQYGPIGVSVFAIALGLYLLVRWMQRRKVLKHLEKIPRLSVDEWASWMSDGKAATLLDVRPDPYDPIPGAQPFDLHAPPGTLQLEDPETHIVVYCSCPNEISAALLAMKLRSTGYPNTWALLGGYEAWLAHRRTSETAMSQMESTDAMAHCAGG